MPLPARLTRFALSAWLLLTALTPVTSLAIEPVRVVATGGRIGYTFSTPAAGNSVFRHRSPHKLGGPVAELQVGFMDWMYTDKTETANATNDVTITHAWLERASTGQVVPLTFAGQRQLVLPMNSTTPVWLSDTIPSSTWTGAAPARDEVFWLHARGTIPEGGKVPVGTPTTFTGSRFVAYAPANEPGTYDTAGTVPTIANGATRVDGLPLVVLGRFTGPGHLAVIGIGDSILNGSGDAANPVPVISGFGFFNRAALDTNGANAIAMFNLTRHGQSAGYWITPSRQSRQAPFLKYANVVVEEYGTNDLSQAGTGDPATILSRVQTIWATARAQGVQKIVRTLLMPRTTSTDSWTTVNSQTPLPGWGAGDKRDTINAGLVAALSATDPRYRVDIIVDTLAVLADPVDSGRWLTNGTPRYTADDGTHVSPSGNALLAPHLRAALLSLTVDENVPNYPNWSKTIDWASADSSPLADPNGDGINNQLAYALNLDPLSPAPAAALPSVAIDNATVGGPWLSFEYRENKNAADLVYTVISSTDLAEWTPVIPDGVDSISEIANPDPDGDGATILRRIRVRHSSGSRFLRLGVLR
jgi:lysophospholipase L1-like esterase